MPASKEIAYENILKQIETAAKEYRSLWKLKIPKNSVLLGIHSLFRK